MIWAQVAWTRFWGWDPKEVWALITFLFLCRLLTPSAIKRLAWEEIGLAVSYRFAIIMFNLLFINLVVAGLHSYA